MTKPKKKSALSEKEGVSNPENISDNSISKLKHKRKKQPTPEELSAAIISGDKVALSRAITLIESTNPDHTQKANKIIEACLPYANNSVRLGITGVPGVGKSTFIESFGSYLTTKGKKVAVLAVDPSSSISKGSILGDKTRMEELVKNENAFIRPSPSGDSLGGVARKTRETIILCEACGFDTIIIETVGVGQSETAVHSMVDFFLLLKLAGAGDELQGIKRGIMEMADAILINKADGDNIGRAKQAKIEFTRALHLYPPKENGWIPKVLTASAIENKGIEKTWQLIVKFINHSQSNDSFNRKRAQQNKQWLLQTINERLKSSFYNHPTIKERLKNQLDLLENNKVSPFAAAEYLFKIYIQE
ncbi:methylmalonyl-CoA mutase metallochaperone MeaB [Zhouia amylolytica]|uniref:Arginine/ornithine transport system ATPase n=2 Tax=Zhouia amylolytica TaxID=376730 RepID=W2UQ10_9FLAO|nr:methylmalonyl Co-A mutase-associated GTPase MeaB [Zhouia amylolytica]ETN96039.1 arginine/ornithine transport system ATPase [Zhouia amylolytica AD3]MCQ0111326.1 methylmalonyl Co-A mutase-associated GTPase MeaB [Zhouia amylolytica]SFS50403.1 methylmalonyl-CoA mutase metallochaperone MeaB [Zhouia amylolytica]